MKVPAGRPEPRSVIVTAVPGEVGLGLAEQLKLPKLATCTSTVSLTMTGLELTTRTLYVPLAKIEGMGKEMGLEPLAVEVGDAKLPVASDNWAVKVLPAPKVPVVAKATLMLEPAHTVGTGGMLVMSMVGVAATVTSNTRMASMAKEGSAAVVLCPLTKRTANRRLAGRVIGSVMVSAYHCADRPLNCEPTPGSEEESALQLAPPFVL